MTINGKDVSVRELLDAAREVFDVEIGGLELVRESLDEGFARALALLAACTGRVVVTGIGKSGLVGRKIAATLSSTGTPSFFLHPVEGAHGDMGMLRPEDVVLAISNSGETDELNTLLPAVRSLGAKVVALTGGEQSSLARMSDEVVLVRVEREACPMGLAPTASTTAALAAGDALAVCLMRLNDFDSQDFKKFHPGGSLGKRLESLVEELMRTSDLPLVDQGASIAEGLAALDQGGYGLAVAVDASGKLVGVFTDGDLRRLLCRGPLERGARLSEVMTKDPLRATPSMRAAQALDLMESRQVLVLPVVSGDQTVVGMIHLHDLLGKGRVKFSAAPE